MIEYSFHNVSKPLFFEATEAWVEKVANQLFTSIDGVGFVFCSDEDLLHINQKRLSHDYYTDIITFDLRDQLSDPLVCDIYISLDRVKENALSFNCTFAEELKRVMVHGLLHLTGMNDSTEEEKQAMRLAENKYINLK